MPFSKKKAAGTAFKLAREARHVPLTPAGWAWFIAKKLIGGQREDAEPVPFAIKALAPFRFFQFLMGLVVIGLYGQDISRWAKNGESISPGWAYAVAMGSLSAIICLPLWFMDRLRLKYILFSVDAAMSFFWLIAFGIFGKLYIPHPNENGEVTRMKNAVWIVLIELLLWSVTASVMAFFWFRHTKSPRQQYAEDLEKNYPSDSDSVQHVAMPPQAYVQGRY